MFSGSSTIIIVTVIAVFVAILIIAISFFTIILLYFKKRKKREEPEPEHEYETVDPLQTSPQTASNDELMELNNAVDAHSMIIPKENVAYRATEMNSSWLL